MTRPEQIHKSCLGGSGSSKLDKGRCVAGHQPSTAKLHQHCGQHSIQRPGLLDGERWPGVLPGSPHQPHRRHAVQANSHAHPSAHLHDDGWYLRMACLLHLCCIKQPSHAMNG